MQRYFDRLWSVAVGKPTPIDIDRELDDTYAFFLNCFHLGDWLKADPAFTAATSQEIERYIRQSPGLALCADIANAAKHLRPGRDLKSGTPPGNLRAMVTGSWAQTFAFDGIEREFDQATIYVEHGGGLVAVVTLAERAVNEWREFLRQRGVST